MKTKSLIAAILASVGLSVSADVLYWQVSGTSTEYDRAFLMARVVDSTGEHLYYASENVTSSGSALGAAAVPAVFENGGYAAATWDATKFLSWSDGSSSLGTFEPANSTVSFYVELWNGGIDHSNWAGRTADMSYSDVSNLVKSGFNPSFEGVNSALGHGANVITTVPEPTSGLLMLVGLGALALRRRKVA